MDLTVLSVNNLMAKKCEHTVTYYDRKTDKFKCQFCGKEVDKLKMGESKSVQIPKPGSRISTKK